MSRAVVIAVLLVLLAGRAHAQDTTQDTTAATLRRARDLYEQLELERALPLFREIVSPAWTFDVTAAQRVEANLYLGAGLVLLGARDSAVTHFRAALERDPFADLDPSRFTPAQLDAFQAARRAVFRMAYARSWRRASTRARTGCRSPWLRPTPRRCDARSGQRSAGSGFRSSWAKSLGCGKSNGTACWRTVSSLPPVATPSC
jgi:hypothetical protein